MELKEAEEKSLKESERLEREVVEVQELKVMERNSPMLTSYMYNIQFLTAIVFM